jgi:hypothetical protein
MNALPDCDRGFAARQEVHRGSSGCRPVAQPGQPATRQARRARRPGRQGRSQKKLTTSRPSEEAPHGEVRLLYWDTSERRDDQPPPLRTGQLVRIITCNMDCPSTPSRWAGTSLDFRHFRNCSWCDRSRSAALQEGRRPGDFLSRRARHGSRNISGCSQPGSGALSANWRKSRLGSTSAILTL